MTTPSAAEAAFLRAIFDQPEEDGPRLVYADWLDERGEADRAELIRVQCRLESMPHTDRKPLRRWHQEWKLMGRVRDTLGKVPQSVALSFERGLPTVAMRLNDFLTRHTAWLRRHLEAGRIGRLVLRAGVRAPLDDYVRRLVASVAGSSLPPVTLDLSLGDFGEGFLAYLPDVPRLDRLGLADLPVTDARVEGLLALPRLTWLNLGGTLVGDAGLAAVGRLTNLCSLDLGATLVTDAGLSHLTGLTRLADLDLRDTAVGEPGLRLLATLPGLRRLYFPTTRLSARAEQCFPRERPDVRLNHCRGADDS
jgi:uncharacterized protein (TIGR02996 family)